MSMYYIYHQCHTLIIYVAVRKPFQELITIYSIHLT